MLSTSGRLPKDSKSKTITEGSKAGKLHSRMGVDILRIVNNLYSVVHSSTSRSNASAISDTGASGYYLKVDAPHDLASRTVALIQEKQPNGKILHSTKVCRLELAHSE